MAYSEEEISLYTNILKKFNDGINLYSPILENIPLKTPEKVSCENCGNTHFFKDHGFSLLRWRRAIRVLLKRRAIETCV